MRAGIVGVILTGALSVIPVTAVAANTAPQNDPTISISQGQISLLAIWIATGVAALVIALVALSVSRRRARALALRSIADPSNGTPVMIG